MTQQNYIIYIIAVLNITSFFFNFATTINVSIYNISNHESTVAIHFKLAPNDFIYKEYIQLSIDDPYITMNDWQSNIEAVSHYDSTFKDTKKIYNQDFTITTRVHYDPKHNLENVHLRINYFSHKAANFREKIIPLTFHQEIQENTTSNTILNSHLPKATKTDIRHINTPAQKLAKKATSWKKYISRSIETTQRPWIRVILIFLLGILVSLTPCIYPMIPITIGILQAQAKKSIIHNFFSAFFYTLGLSTTFALLGLLAAFAGQQLGTLMSNSWVILLLVSLLVYIAGSLFGCYDLYIPKFLQTTNRIYSGTLISAYLFGLISGTVASPCVSPALILVLTIVSNLQNLFWGFILLLIFGFGMSMPLLIVGTFSSSITILPAAGSWMVEIKRLIGFILIGMCIYFLNFILPWYIVSWIIASANFSAGIFYSFSAQYYADKHRTIKTFIGIILIASSVFFAIKGFQALLLGTN